MSAGPLEAADEPPLPLPLHGLKLFLAGFALALANFMVVLDMTVANVSVPHIAGGLAVSPSQGTWVITSYAVAEAITVPLTGWLSNRFGTVRCLAGSLAGFGLFSLLCGFAPTIEALVLCRVLQGLSGGPLMPLTQVMLSRVFPKEKLGMAMGLWATTTIAAPVLGPITGGWISDNWTWPWVFFINLPVVITCFAIVTRLLPPFETPIRRVGIDVVGLILLIIWVGCFQILLDTGREHDWFQSDTMLTLAIVAGLGLVVFVVWEWFCPAPVVNLRLLRDRSLATATLAFGLGFAGLYLGIVLIPLWLQQVVGYTAGEAGIVLSSQGLIAIFIAPLAALSLKRFDPRLTVSLALLWMLLMNLIRTTWSTDTTHFWLVAPQLFTGIAMPFFFIGVTTLSISGQPARHIASAAGIVTFFRTMCGAVATAIGTTLWITTGQTERAELAGVMNDAQGAANQMQQVGLSPEQALATLDQMLEGQALTTSLLYVYACSTLLFVIAASVIWLAPKPVGPLKADVGH